MVSSCGRLADAAAAAAASSACLRSADRVSVAVLVTSECPVHTLLCQSLLLVLLESRIAVLPLNGGIRSRLCEVQVHLAPEQVEALEVVDGILRAVHAVVDDESLPLALKTLLRDDFDDVAEFVEEAVERVDQGRDLDLLVEVADLFC